MSTRSRVRRTLLPLLAGAAALLAVAPAARATVVERVVAVVGDRPVLWTELLQRAAPLRAQIRAQAQDPNVVSAQEQAMHRELLDRMIDDRLEEQQADRAHVSVSAEEVDRALANIAQQASLQQGRPITPRDVLDEVGARGMREQDFRDELRRQILEGKLLELRVRPRVRVTEQDAQATYERWVRERQEQHLVDVRVIALRVSPPTTQVAEAQLALANTIVAQVRQGVSFCALAARYNGGATSQTCGATSPQPVGTLLPAIRDAIARLPVGAVSDPIRVHVVQDDVIVVLMPMGEPATPGYDEVRDEMMQRAAGDGLERERREWLRELRRGAYVDVRL
jgi:peptidyl-prolyl cis-trans isomerase SurA